MPAAKVSGEWPTVKQVAKRLKVRVDEVYRLLHSGKLKGAKIRRYADGERPTSSMDSIAYSPGNPLIWLIDPASVEELLHGRKHGRR